MVLCEFRTFLLQGYKRIGNSHDTLRPTQLPTKALFKLFLPSLYCYKPLCTNAELIFNDPDSPSVILTSFLICVLLSFTQTIAFSDFAATAANYITSVLSKCLFRIYFNYLIRFFSIMAA